MPDLFERHRSLLERAVQAVESREYWAPFNEIPSTKFYGDNAKLDGETAFAALLNQPFDLPGHPETARVGAEFSPWGQELAIAYPAAPADELIAASLASAASLADATPELRLGVLLEALTRLNALSFLIAHATMHTTGQAFPMAFQAGGPHAQDRGLEALAIAWTEMTRGAKLACWEKPQGKLPPLVIEKQWLLVPRGLALTVGCNTFPTWNSYPGIFASLATGNPVIIKPHPHAILPLALTVRVLREVFAEAGLAADAVLLAADEPGAEITKTLVQHPDIKIIDYTGSSTFADWIRQNADNAQIFTEETGVNSVVITGTDDFKGMCDNLAFSLALYSGQMCTAPQNIYIPKDGITTNEGEKTFAEVAQGIAHAIDALLSDPVRAANICGAIVNPATLERVAQARQLGRTVRESAAFSPDQARSATPLMVAVASPTGPQDEECFGPVSFIIPCADAKEAIACAAAVAKRKGAITAALYATDEALIAEAKPAFAHAGVNLSLNLMGNIYVNQSAAFSDFHVTGANPAGNASLTDAAFIVPRFRRVMMRWPKKLT